jgi:hypothetical protein
MREVPAAPPVGKSPEMSLLENPALFRSLTILIA